MATKTKAQIAVDKQKQALQDKLDVSLENLKVLKDEYGLLDEMNKLTDDITKQSKSQLEVTKDIIDKTKDVFDNTKKITEETLTTVNLHKIERQAIAEGLSDRVEIIQKMKSIQEIQKETNRVVNVQANAFKSIGDSIDGMIKTIPGIGGVLADALGTSEMGNELSEQFRTAFAEAFDAGGVADNIQQGMVEGATSGFVESSLTNTSRKGFMQGIPSALKSVGVLAALIGATKFGFSGGIESLDFKNRFKRIIAGTTFDAFKDAFGNVNKSSFMNIFRSRLMGVRFGVEQTDIAKILRAQTEISGLTDRQAFNVQNSIARLASRQGVLAKDVFSDIAANTEMFAKFAKDGGQNIGLAAVQAKKLGLSLDTVGTIAESVLDFQSSIESELKASLILGRQLNLNRARELALAGNMAGLQEEIVRLVGSEQELNKLNVIERKTLAQALGITVEQLSKLAGGELEVKNSEMKQNTDQMAALTRALTIFTIAQGFRVGIPLLGKGIDMAAGIAGSGVVTIGKNGQLYEKGRRGSLKKTKTNLMRTSRVGRVALMGSRLIPQIALISAGIFALTKVVQHISGKSDDIADNTKQTVSTMARDSNWPLITSDKVGSGAKYIPNKG